MMLNVAQIIRQHLLLILLVMPIPACFSRFRPDLLLVNLNIGGFNEKDVSRNISYT
jgi:hypothetical protein